MYNLSPRKGLPLIGCTPSNVGPSTYTFCSPFAITRKNHAPFLSCTERKFIIAQKPYTQAIYDADVKKKIKGGSGFQSKSKRFVYKEDDTPGPTTYDPKKNKKCPKLDPTPIPGKGKLYVCRVPYTLKGSGPSVPTHHDQNGYTLDDDGDLIKLPPDYCDQTLGPAFYNVQLEPCRTTQLYKGCRWSRSKSKRSTLQSNLNPGPGTYDVKLPACIVNEEDEEFREMARLLSFLPRYTEDKQLRTIKEDLPGPGYYNVATSSFTFKKSLSVNPVPFISASKRLKYDTSQLPGPDAYTIPNFCINPKRVSRKQTLFGFEAERFPNKKHQSQPGPGAYEIKGDIEDKLTRKINPYSTVVAPFNILAERKIGFISKDVYFMPGPDEYTLEPFEKEEAAADCCVFRSTTNRFPKKKKSGDADPASYSISEQFNKNRGRTSHYAGKVPFQSSQSRGFIRINDNPGPADYLSQKGIGEKGYYFNASPRFLHKAEETPGPGSYTLHASIGRSLYRAIGTHNIRLKENVCKCKIRKSPASTYNEWTKVMLKTKKLRWFQKPTSEYRHCVEDT